MLPLTATMGTGEDHRLQPSKSSRSPLAQSTPSPAASGLPVEGGSSRCETPGCDCPGFSASPSSKAATVSGGRYCAGCGHSWLPHAALWESSAGVERVASLVLYGCHALPIRLKILLDRLLATLDREQVLHLLASFGWTLEDYARGYILQDASGDMLQRWQICSEEEEPIVLRKFLDFPETRSLAIKLMQPNGGNRSNSPDNSGIQLSRSRLMSFSHRTVLKIPSPPSAAITSPPTGDTISHMMSPLYQLQNMQPLNFCRVERQQPSHQEPPGLINLTIPKQVLKVKSNLEETDQSRTSFNSGAPFSQKSSPPGSIYSEVDNRSRGSSNFLQSGDEDDDVENFQGAINLSRDSGDDRKPVQNSKHRPSSPGRRRWGSDVLELAFSLGTPLVNQVTGKKRVQCNVCLKTFCDKGALKIHFSAVHLREMHKCTVEGCNMMFSSRRSRNRHSANPNPKLHSSNCRRKMTLSHSTAFTSLNGDVTNSSTSNPPPAGESVNLDRYRLNATSHNLSSHEVDDLPEAESSQQSFSNFVFKEESDSDAGESLEEGRDNGGRTFIDQLKRKIDQERLMQTIFTEIESSLESNSFRSKECSTYQENSDKCGAEVVTNDLPVRGVRKRKSRNPTRYGSALKRVSVSPPPDPHLDVETEEMRASSETDKRLDNKQLINCSNDENVFRERQICEETSTNHNVIADDDHQSREGTTTLTSVKDDHNTLNKETSKVGTDHEEAFPESTESALSGEQIGTSITEAGQEIFEGLPVSEIALHNQSPSASEEDSSDSAGKEIPIDKENPKRCTQCGKVFQNHSSAKIHYRNVHLKLMHRCKVQGCNASFSSKRSRDRHSANIKLHRNIQEDPDNGAKSQVNGHKAATNKKSDEKSVSDTELTI